MKIGIEKLTESCQEKSVNHVTEEEGLPRFAELWDADVRQHFLLQNLLCVLDTLLLCYTWKLPKFCWRNHMLNDKSVIVQNIFRIFWAVRLNNDLFYTFCGRKSFKIYQALLLWFRWNWERCFVPEWRKPRPTKVWPERKSKY